MKQYFSIKMLCLSVMGWLFCSFTFAQSYQQLSHRIDSLSNIGLPKSALEQVELLDHLARKEHNSAQQVKAVIYRMTFQSYIEEAPLLAIITRLKQDIAKAEYPVKPMLQSLLGGIYYAYYQQNRWQFSQRTHLAVAGDDINKWDLQTINNETERMFKLSLQDYKQEQNTPVSVLDGVLAGDTKNRYLRPTLYDILVQLALTFLLSEEPAISRPKLPFVLNDPRLFGDSRTFAGLVIATNDTASTFYQGIKYLQQLTAFHLQTPNSEALADVDLERLEFLSRNATVAGKDSLYMAAIDPIVKQFWGKAVGGNALVLQGKFEYDRDNLVAARSYFYKELEDASPASLGSYNAEGYIKLIEQKALSANIENENVPDKPVLALLNYRNIKTARVLVYKVSTTQYNELAKIRSDINQYIDGITIYASDSVFHYLNKLKPVQNEVLTLPDPKDFRQHSTDFKVNPQPTGHYVLIIKEDGNYDATVTALTAFKVCNLSLTTRRISDDKVEVKVLNRLTGKPVRDVHVTVAEVQDVVTDKNGACIANVSANNNYSFNYSVKLVKGQDTLYEGSRFAGYYNRSRENPVRTILFTDRQIYRPGQTLYYKGLHIETHDAKSTIISNKNLTVTITDNNGKLLTSIPVTTNSFGTFAGSYTIPQNILNGSIIIRTDGGQKFVQVEEYKRPSFQVDLMAVTGTNHIGDTITVNGQVKAFSGYGLSGARVVYHITRNMTLKDYTQYRKYGQALYRSVEIKADTVKTDAQGNFKVKFKAANNDGEDMTALDFNYQVTADVTDGSGETRSANSRVVVGLHDIALVAYTGQRMFSRDSVTSSLSNLNGVQQAGTMDVKIYALNSPEQTLKKALWNAPDQFMLPHDQFKKDFPEYPYKNETEVQSWAVKSQVATMHFTTDADRRTKFSLDALGKEPSGTYKMVISGKNTGGDTTSVTRFIYLLNAPGKPEVYENWLIPLSTTVDSAGSASFLIGTGKAGKVLMEKFHGNQRISSQWINIRGGKQQLLKIPVGADELNLSIHFLMAQQNRLYTINQVVFNAFKLRQSNLNVKFLTFRDKLQPGEKEQWKLQISGNKNEKVAAEMLASLYDASLDKITAPDGAWISALIPNYYGVNYGENWTENFVYPLNTNPLRYANISFNYQTQPYETLNMFGYSYYGGYNYNYRRQLVVDKARATIKADTVEYKASAFTLRGNNNQLNEVSVVGYGTVMKRDLTGSVATVRLNGKSFAGEDILKKEQNLPVDVIESVQQINNYSFQSSPRFTLRGNSQPIETRKNFNETAFFYPQLHTNEQGEILIDFTIPESLTKWKFRAFATTTDLKSGYIEKTIVTQKQLSINANTPRFLREGDTITISARLANLTASAISGKVNLQLFNGINMQPVTLLTNPGDAQQSFTINAASTKPVSFKLVVPSRLEALTYRLTADGGTVTDGEENTIPVLPNRMLVTESMPMMVRSGQTKAFTFEKLVNPKSTTLQNKTFTLEYTQNPAWYAVQALPYMMEFPYECSEQIFSRYYANAMGTSLVNKLPIVKQVFDQWKAVNSPQLLSNLEKNQELKSTLIEETPWLRDAISESEQKKRIALLFDLNKMSYELKQNIDKLKERQLPDGGFPWFGGDKSDQYITRHIVEGIGQLYHLGIADSTNSTLKDIAGKALTCVGDILIDNADWQKKHNNYEGRLLSQSEIHSWYVESYFAGKPLSPALKPLLDNYLDITQQQWVHDDIYEQGMIALTMLRYNRPAVAQKIIRSLTETAQHTDDMGMYWGKNLLGYFWYQSPIETQCLMIELFTEAGDTKAVDEMKIWLLRNKQTNNWKTTKATAAACYALLLKGSDWLADNGTSEIKLGGQNLDDLKPGLKADAGTGYIKTTWTDGDIKPDLGKVNIKNNGKTISWGSVNWQYLENLDKITPSQADIHLERKYFIQKQTDNGAMLTAVDATHKPKVGDLLKVVVYLKAGRDFEYVQLKDMRPSGTEPVDVLSGYKYQDGLYYYQVTKDVATNFFISNLNKGSYVFEYRLRVAQPGNFSTGISTVQCMYAPEFNAHSEGKRMVVQ